eukprot:CAMPEP_0173187294 /NCGR_PEP_ID=MMETSP1141-20130122/10623_1 /TAXON_ID=483371 /ORGANISM="non described non described, Strain CCMP2298" /LENGTH=140 /DNA_ID=CAMNT_0014111103 /DNA_START=301 /DNA_END=723 /DNA_ORIENTATION=+
MPLFEALMDPQMSATSNTDRKGVYCALLLQKTGKFVFNPKPTATGNRTTLRVDRTRSLALMDTYSPASRVTSRGVITTAATVEAAVINIDSARSALAIMVTRLEAVPPGAQPTRMRPDASSGLRPMTRLRAAAENGMIVY